VRSDYAVVIACLTVPEDINQFTHEENLVTKKEKTMNTNRKAAKLAVLALVLMATVALLATSSVAQDLKVKREITIAQLAGPWQIAVAGNTGCGVSSLLFTGTLNSSGVATGTLTGSSAGCGSNSTTETFTILSLGSDGTGTAGLSCGSGCGWKFNIKVSPNKQVFNLVDVSDGGSNVLAGTAVK